MFFVIFLDKQQRTSTSTLICWVFVWIQGSLAKTTPFSNKVLQRFCIETTQVFLEEKKSTLNFQPPRLWYFFGTPKTQQFVSLWRLCQWPAQPFCLKRLGTKYSNFRVSAAGVESGLCKARFFRYTFSTLGQLTPRKGPGSSVHMHQQALWPRPDMCCVTPSLNLERNLQGWQGVPNTTLQLRHIFHPWQERNGWKFFDKAIKTSWGGRTNFFEAAIFGGPVYM